MPSAGDHESVSKPTDPANLGGTRKLRHAVVVQAHAWLVIKEGSTTEVQHRVTGPR